MRRWSFGSSSFCARQPLSARARASLHRSSPRRLAYESARSCASHEPRRFREGEIDALIETRDQPRDEARDLPPGRMSRSTLGPGSQRRRTNVPIRPSLNTTRPYSIKWQFLEYWIPCSRNRPALDATTAGPSSRATAPGGAASREANSRRDHRGPQRDDDRPTRWHTRGTRSRFCKGIWLNHTPSRARLAYLVMMGPGFESPRRLRWRPRM
jgi:hypothetical protein